MIIVAHLAPTANYFNWGSRFPRRESEVAKDTVVRVSWIGTAGRDLDMMQLYNYNPITNYVWYVDSGQPLPTGYYSNVVRRTYDQTTYGNIRLYSKLGFSNFNGIQLEAEKRYSQGLAFQVFYVLSNSTSTGALPSQGGNFTANGVYQPDIFLPGALPQDLHDRVKFLNYQRDIDIPQHRVRWNFLYDLPMGRGKRFLNRSGSVLDRLVGGWQVAGYGSTNSRWFNLPGSAPGSAANWGSFGSVDVYGTKYQVSDCRSGQCFPGYLYFNGYIPANRVNVAGGVLGIPQNYTPSSTPVWPTPADGGSPSDPNSRYYETNNVFVPLKNGTSQLVPQDTGLNPFRNQAVKGPWLTSMNASLYKTVPLTERVKLRINLDAFNRFVAL